ncbi:MAG: GNAT family N-acetyltransferase [Deltaproteobacteria bacterium]|nr:GNAT family N-acetyltransferase [Deltaproteobacteria bacterium]
MRSTLAGRPLVFRDDPYSQRVRCDHPQVSDGALLGERLLGEAEERGRPRVVVLAAARLAEGLTSAGLWEEARMPGYYRGEEDCVVLGGAPHGAIGLADPEGVARVDALLPGYPVDGSAPDLVSLRAAPEHAPLVAALVAEAFRYYPTPTGDPAYVRDQVEAGVPFRLLMDGGQPVAVASADLDRAALTAEITDCVVLPSHRRQGLMRALIRDLMGDLRGMDYPTAFTLARAVVPGINLAFRGMGFAYRGRMLRSCRIGDGLEDMNVWSRRL